MSKKNDINKELLDILHLEGWTNEAQLPGSTRLAEDLSLDSFDFVRLILAINQHFAIQIGSHEMVPSNLSTLSQLITLIKSKLEGV